MKMENAIRVGAELHERALETEITRLLAKSAFKRNAFDIIRSHNRSLSKASTNKKKPPEHQDDNILLMKCEPAHELRPKSFASTSG